VLTKEALARQPAARLDAVDAVIGVVRQVDAEVAANPAQGISDRAILRVAPAIDGIASG